MFSRRGEGPLQAGSAQPAAGVCLLHCGGVTSVHLLLAAGLVPDKGWGGCWEGEGVDVGVGGRVGAPRAPDTLEHRQELVSYRRSLLRSQSPFWKPGGKRAYSEHPEVQPWEMRNRGTRRCCQGRWMHHPRPRVYSPGADPVICPGQVWKARQH